MNNNIKQPKPENCVKIEVYHDTETQTDFRVLTPQRFAPEWGDMVRDESKPLRFFSSVGLNTPAGPRIWNFEIKAKTLEAAILSYAVEAERAGKAGVEELESQFRRASLLAGVEAASPRKQ